MQNQLTKQDIFEIVNGVVNKAVDNSKQELLGVINKTNQDTLKIINRSNQNLLGIIKKTNQDTLEFFNSSNQDLLEVINKSFSEIEQRMATKADLLGLATKVDLIELRMATKSDLAATETRLVTKDYLDKKLSEFRGDLMGIIKKEDDKLGALANQLANHKVLPAKEIHQVLAMEPFAKIS